MKPNLPTHIKN